jgi:hypothetical protein
LNDDDVGGCHVAFSALTILQFGQLQLDLIETTPVRLWYSILQRSFETIGENIQRSRNVMLGRYAASLPSSQATRRR